MTTPAARGGKDAGRPHGGEQPDQAMLDAADAEPRLVVTWVDGKMVKTRVPAADRLVTKTVWRVMPGSEPLKLATLRLDGERMTHDLHTALGTALLTDGIYTMQTGRVHLEDGPVFFHALDKAFANSSTISIETTE